MNATRPALRIEVCEDRVLPSGFTVPDAGPLPPLSVAPISYTRSDGDSSAATDPVSTYTNNLQPTASQPGVPLSTSLAGADASNGGSAFVALDVRPSTGSTDADATNGESAFGMPGVSSSGLAQLSTFDNSGFGAGTTLLPAFGSPGGWDWVIVVTATDLATSRPPLPSFDHGSGDAEDTPNGDGDAPSSGASDNGDPGPSAPPDAMASAPDSIASAPDSANAAAASGTLFAASSQPFGTVALAVAAQNSAALHSATDVNYAAISLTVGQPGSGLQPVGTFGLPAFGQGDVALPAVGYSRPSATPATVVSPIGTDPMEASGTTDATLARIAVPARGLVDQPLPALAGLDTAELDAKVSSLFSALARFGVELASDLQQPEVYSWLAAAGLLSVGAAYTAWSGTKEKRTTRSPLPRRVLGQWEGR